MRSATDPKSTVSGALEGEHDTKVANEEWDG